MKNKFIHDSLLGFSKQLGYLKSLKIIFITKTIHTVPRKINIDHPKLRYHRTFLDVKWFKWSDISLKEFKEQISNHFVFQYLFQQRKIQCHLEGISSLT